VWQSSTRRHSQIWLQVREENRTIYKFGGLELRTKNQQFQFWLIKTYSKPNQSFLNWVQNQNWVLIFF
jgi:hypothetical protein